MVSELMSERIVGNERRIFAAKHNMTKQVWSKATNGRNRQNGENGGDAPGGVPIITMGGTTRQRSVMATMVLVVCDHGEDPIENARVGAVHKIPVQSEQYVHKKN